MKSYRDGPLALGALLAGAGLGVTAAGDVHALAIGFAVSGLLLMAWAFVPDARHRRRIIADDATKLATEIFQFSADRSRDRPIEYRQGWDGMTEKERTDAFRAESNALEKTFRETMSRYRERFTARSLTIADRLIAENALHRDDRWHFEHPTNPLGIDEVGRLLLSGAERLRSGRQVKSRRSR